MMILTALATTASLVGQGEAPAPDTDVVAMPESNPFGTAALRHGSEGPGVAALQRALNTTLEPSPSLSVTGVFDAETEAAVLRFQKERNIEISGVVGRRMMTALGAEVDAYLSLTPTVLSEIGPQVITRNTIEASNGDIWLASWHGVIRYDGTHFINVTKTEGLRSYRAFSLLEDHAGHVWIGTTGAGAYRFDGQTFTNITSDDGLATDVVLSLMQDRDNNIWLGGHGVTRYDGTTFTTFTEEDGFTDADVSSISQAPDGTMWFGTRGALFRYDGETFVDMTKELGLSIGSYIPTVIDRRGNLWFGGWNGLYHYDGTDLRYVFLEECFSLMEDSKGNIWFSGGSMDGEDPKPGFSVLNRFDPAAGIDRLMATKAQIEVEAGMIFGLTEDAAGGIWFGTGRGVGRIDGETVKYWRD